MTTRIEVDFNARDAVGHIPAALSEADGPVALGDYVDMHDEDGFRCLAFVASIGEGSLGATPLWSTFAAEGESRVVPNPAPGWRVVNRLSMIFERPTYRRDFTPTGLSQPLRS
jgi:hypothetical protein